MPQRTNKYQKLVLFISRQFASSTSKVYESKMLWDSCSEQKREVDIVIEETAGLYPLLVGIECTAQKKKFGIKQIEQIHQKHKNLNIGKTVIVSESGFVSKCHTYAKKHNIELLNFKSACEMQWPEWTHQIPELSASHTSFKPLEISLNIYNPYLLDFQHTENMYLKSPELGKLMAHDFIYAYFNSNSKTVKNIKNQINTEVWDFEPALEITNDYGSKALCTSITVKYSYTESDLETKHNEFYDQPIIHGISETDGTYKFVGITMSPTGELLDNGKPTYSVTVHADTK